MPYKKHFKYFPYMSKSCPLRLVSQSGPTDLRHFDPEFTHLPVSSSLCTDAPTVTSSVKEAAGAFPGFSYGPPADHSFMWTSTLLTRLSEELTRTRTKSLDFRVLFLDWGDHAGAACTGRGGTLHTLMRGSNWQDGHENLWGILCMKSVQMGTLTLQHGQALLFCLNRPKIKKKKYTCAKYGSTLRSLNIALRGRGTSQLLVKWREEKCLRFKRQFGNGSSSVIRKTANPFHSFGLFDLSARCWGGCLQLHVYICSNCFCCFHVNAQLHLRKQGSRKANRSASSISNFGLDSCISLFIFISVVWTQKLTAFQWCTLGPNC